MEKSELVKEFTELFFATNGSTATVSKNQPRPDKVKFDYTRIFNELSEQNYSNHLRTAVGLVPIPIIDVEYCFWGAIDIDIYGMSLEDQIKIIKLAEEYKCVSAWSESKGLHLYCQSDEKVLAKGMRNYLLSVASKLNFKQLPEVFPKQIKLGTKNGKKEIGNGIKLPYRNYFNTQTITSTGITVLDNKIVQLKPEIFIKRLKDNKIELDVFKNFYNMDLEATLETIPGETALGSMNDPEIKKLTAKEIIKRIKSEKMTLNDNDSYFDDLVTLAIGKMVGSRISTDEDILDLFLDLDPETTVDYYRAKLDRCRASLGIDDPKFIREKMVNNIVYLKETDRFFDLTTNRDYKKETINYTYGIYFGKKETPLSFLQRHPHARSVESWLYDPAQYDKDKKIITVDGNQYLNSYKPNNLVPEKGEVKLLYELLNHVFNNNVKYINHFLDFISYPLKNPGAKIRHALIIVSTAFQFGKGTLWRILGEVYGENSLAIDVNQALDKSKGYTQKAQMVLIDEMQSLGTFGETQSLLNDLKRIITEKEVSSRELYKDYKIIKTCANYILFSNNKNALSLKPNEVRYWVYITEAPRKEQEFYTKIHKWLDNGGAKAVLYELLNRKISDSFDPNAIAPKTPFLDTMSKSGEHPLTAIIRSLYEENHKPFINNSNEEIHIIGSKELFDWLRINNLLGRARINDVSNALEQIGAINLGQVRIRQKTHTVEDTEAVLYEAANLEYKHPWKYITTKPTLYLLPRRLDLANTPTQELVDEMYKPIKIEKEHKDGF